MKIGDLVKLQGTVAVAAQTLFEERVAFGTWAVDSIEPDGCVVVTPLGEDSPKIRAAPTDLVMQAKASDAYAFWSHDAFPYVLGGRVVAVRPSGRVEIDGWSNMVFRPVANTTIVTGTALRAAIERITGAYDAEREQLRIRKLSDVCQAFTDAGVQLPEHLKRALDSLRHAAQKPHTHAQTEAALRERVAVLEAALRPFAEMADGRDAWSDATQTCGVFPTLAQVRAARAALAGTATLAALVAEVQRAALEEAAAEIDCNDSECSCQGDRHAEKLRVLAAKKAGQVG